MIVVDTNIISTLARIQALPLLRRLMRADRLYVTPATYHELRRAIEAGCHFLVPILAAIQAGGELDLVELDRREILTIKDLPSSLGAGEAESIAICLNRRDARLVTNDKRARNFCREQSIPCLDLSGVLRELWLRGLMTKELVRELIRQIEREPGMVIRSKEQIFK